MKKIIEMEKIIEENNWNVNVIITLTLKCHHHHHHHHHYHHHHHHHHRHTKVDCKSYYRNNDFNDNSIHQEIILMTTSPNSN